MDKFLPKLKYTQEQLDDALWSACTSDDVIAMKELINEGADIHYKNYLDFNFLHNSVLNCSNRATEFLLSINVDPNLKDKCGCTPLHYAACRGYVDQIRFLLKANANPNANSKNGKTPLDCAKEYNNSKCVELLEKVTSKKINNTNVFMMINDEINSKSKEFHKFINKKNKELLELIESERSKQSERSGEQSE